MTATRFPFRWVAAKTEAIPPTVTKTGNTFGSPAFMAPEQALGRSREIDARTDIYAVGALMFNLLSGEFVHVAESAHEMVIVAATKRPRSLVAVMPETPQPRWPSASGP